MSDVKITKGKNGIMKMTYPQRVATFEQFRKSPDAFTNGQTHSSDSIKKLPGDKDYKQLLLKEQKINEMFGIEILRYVDQLGPDLWLPVVSVFIGTLFSLIGIGAKKGLDEQKAAENVKTELGRLLKEQPEAKKEISGMFKQYGDDKKGLLKALNDKFPKLEAAAQGEAKPEGASMPTE